jgi:hypothetical protein
MTTSDKDLAKKVVPRKKEKVVWRRRSKTFANLSELKYLQRVISVIILGLCIGDSVVPL